MADEINYIAGVRYSQLFIPRWGSFGLVLLYCMSVYALHGLPCWWLERRGEEDYTRIAKTERLQRSC
jgi:hypothetical protein